jgi:adenylate kinase family enzyme
VIAPAEHPRVVVIGSSCAGKSTFAQRLAAARSCDLVELDVLHWDADWTPKPPEVFRRLTAEATSGERWVVAGNYGAVRDIIWLRATTIVWLDLGMPLVLWRGLRRTLKRCLTRETLYHGNRESLRRSFLSKESILVWIASTFHARRKQFTALRASPHGGHLDWFVATDQTRADAILEQLTSSARTAIADRSSPHETRA